MTIPGIPQNLYVQSANQQILTSWDQSPGATSYVVQRSQDNITYTTVATVSGSPLATSYLDTAVTLGVKYYYIVSGVGPGGSSPYALPGSAVPVPTGEMCLSQIRDQAKQRADRVNSNFLTVPEWNQNINKAMFELYDLLVTVFEDYYVAPPIQFNTTGNTYLYPLPNGSNTFLNALDLNQTITPTAFYKLLGVDLQVQNTNNGYVNIQKFNFINRNEFIYPNSASTIYGVFNCRYRIMGNSLQLIPTPSANQGVRLWYIPRLVELLQDTDTTATGISGWVEYVIVRAAKYALDKEESDSSKLDQELLFLKQRIEESAANRDAGTPDTISDLRSTKGYWGSGYGWGGGSNGGF